MLTGALGALILARSGETVEVPERSLRTSRGLETVNGTELWVERMGSGQPIVVVHGGPVMEHGYLVSPLAPLARDYELIFFDQRLSGRSAPEVAEDSVRLDNFARDIEELRKKLGLETMHLVGHSWGGLLAMKYALGYPDRLESLILLDSMAASAALWRQEQQAVAGLVSEEDALARQEIMASAAFVERRPVAIEKLLRLSFKAQFADPAKLEQLDLFVPEDYSRRSAQFSKLGPDLESFDLHEDLKRLHVPTLVLYGDAEPGAGLGGKAIHESLPRSELLVIEDAGHFPFIEQSEATLEAMREFLATAPHRR